MPSFGTPGGSLEQPTWIKGDGSTAAAGRTGEQRTAAILSRLASTEVAVFHDVSIPGSRANVDHVVVAGSTITLIDTKLWRPGFYWASPSGPRRGLDDFPAAKTGTLTLAKARLSALLDRHGVPATFATPLLLVWSSDGSRPVSTWALRIDGVKALPAARFDQRRLGRSAADPRIVEILTRLTR